MNAANPMGWEVVQQDGTRLTWAPTPEGLLIPADRWIRVQQAPQIKPNRKARRKAARKTGSAHT